MAMIRVIQGIAFEGTPSDSFDIKAHQLGNGHLELTATRSTVWQELDWDESEVQEYLDTVRKRREMLVWETQQKHAERAARRASKQVRHRCKAMGVDTLLTLTYRENVTDLALCRRHLKEFNRRVKRVLPGFSFVAGFETQKRGAWHVHMATRAIPKVLPASNGVEVKSFNVIRAIWRSVTQELGGNIDVSRRKRNSQRTPAKIASYIAKYITKSFEDGEKWSNRWTCYGFSAAAIPKPVRMGSVSSLLDALDVCWGMVPDCASVVLNKLDRWKDWFCLHVEVLT